MKYRRSFLVVGAQVLVALASGSAFALDYPAAPRNPVSHSYHGTTVSDDYDWLENSSDEATRQWVGAENALSRAWLDAVPGRSGLHERLAALFGSISSTYFSMHQEHGVLFALKNQPPKQQPLLVSLASPDSTSGERVVLDPGSLSSTGAIAIDFYQPSLDGKRVAVSLSSNGSEVGSLHVFEVATGKELGDVVPRVAFPTGGGSVAWNADGSGFYYTRYPAPGERPDADLQFYQQVYFHRLGTDPARDSYEIGKEFPRIGETLLETSPNGREVLATVGNGDGGDYSIYLKSGKTWRKIAGDADGAKVARFGGDGWLYLRSLADAPRGKILRVSLKDPEIAHAQPVLAQGEFSISDFLVTKGKLYVSLMAGGPSRLIEIDLAKHRQTEIPLPPVTGVEGLVDIGKGEVLANINSYLEPAAWYRVAAGKSPQKTALAQSSSASYADTEVVREFATSKDGTRVPINILRKKGTKLDGSNPVLLTGYGGYGVNRTPRFSASRRVWLDHGGVFAEVNLRGGAEFGDAWHTAGNLTNKQNVFDDFIGAAEYLIKAGYTTPAHLAIQGGSNGGLLMGAVLTQRPELFRAVHSAVGIYDMLRVELDPNGAFNVTEFGSVKDPAQFAALYAYSPLHHVKDGTNYPAILMTTGDNDGRVNPAHSRKMIARLQAADPAGQPILLRTSAASGHGIGSALSVRVDEATDVYAFLMQELGMDLTAQ